MFKNKKLLFLLLTLSIVLSACATNNSMRKPNEYMQDGRQIKYMEAKESSMFDAGEVKNCKITTNSVNVRNGAGKSFEKVGSLEKDSVVKVLDKVGDWYVVQMDNNQVGCIDSSNAVPVIKDGEDKINQQNQSQNGQSSQPPSQANQTSQQQNNMQPTQSKATRFSAQAQQMLDLVNQERSKNGLNPLMADLEVAHVAEVKSQDMVDNNYFSHYSPTYGSPFDMMKSFGVDYLNAGENIAGNSTVQKAHTALMNSSGHRKNILSPDFTHIGIGVKNSDKYGLMFTQMFISKPR